jgi:uncharacterized protein
VAGKRPSKSALFDAAKRWDAAAVRSILGAAPDLLAATLPDGRQAIHLACGVAPGARGLAERNGLRTAATLLDAGADLEAGVPRLADGDFRATPLWFAVSRGENPPLVRALLRRGADASVALWAVVWRDDAAMCRTLLAAKPRLDVVAEGESPIFYAARLRRLATLALLIGAGADPSIRDARGRDAVEIARARKLPKPLVARLEAALR